MHITVGICTWNRCELLTQTLSRLRTLAVPPDVDWEVLVVNNNSTDRTDAVVDSFVGRLPIRRLFEPRPGVACARNRVLREGRGDCVLWTDDDALVDENWATE